MTWSAAEVAVGVPAEVLEHLWPALRHASPGVREGAACALRAALELTAGTLRFGPTQREEVLHARALLFAGGGIEIEHRISPGYTDAAINTCLLYELLSELSE